jgi:CheY-like chemotaxis protein
MLKQDKDSPTLLLVGNVEGARAGVKRLLEMDGYRVLIAATEQEAVESARRERPDLLLVDLGRSPLDTVAVARRIRRRARLSSDVPVVVFPVPMPEPEDADASRRHNVHVTYLIGFEQIETLLGRLLHTGADHAISY